MMRRYRYGGNLATNGWTNHEAREATDIIAYGCYHHFS
jgi:hypothetical protein